MQKNKHRGLHVFMPRKRLIRRVEDESDYFFERLERIDDHFIRSFYSQVICSTIGDVNDFCGSVSSKRNVFYRHLRSLDRLARRSIYKLTGMYHTIHYLASGSFKCGDPADMLESFRIIFALDENERQHFSKYADIFWQCEPMFEVEFCKYAAKRIFGRALIKPSTLAYVNYYFMRSYDQFITTNQNYVA
jgi:hypothetical protein